jgi:Zn-dependent M28 family amino/carboxypeptidase
MIISTIVMAACASAFAASADGPLAADVVAAVSPARVRADVDALCAFGTRHTLSETESATRGIGAARRYLREQLAAIPGVEASFEEFEAPKHPRLPEGGKVVNVVGVMKGTSPGAESRRYYIMGHFDTINLDRLDAKNDAPGGNDNASGTAVVLEAARVLAGKVPDATIVFLCTAGEEQGLFGAKFHAEGAKARGEKILAVLNNDIVGDPSVEFVDAGPLWNDRISAPAMVARKFVRVFSEGIPRNPSAEQLAQIRQLGSESDSPSRQIARYAVDVGVREKLPVLPMMVFRQDRFLRGGDHAAFNDAGFAAVRFSVPAEDYSRQHVNVTQRDGKPYGDLAEFVDAEYVADVTRLNAAMLYHMASAPLAPANVRIITAQLEQTTTLRWDSAAADTDGDVKYEVMWRWTTDPSWRVAKDAGTAREITLPVSKDNYFFGVRAYNAKGFRSPVVFAAAAKE